MEMSVYPDANKENFPGIAVLKDKHGKCNRGVSIPCVVGDYMVGWLKI